MQLYIDVLTWYPNSVIAWVAIHEKITCMQYMHITGPTYRPPHNACPDYRKNARPLLLVKSEFPGYNGSSQQPYLRLTALTFGFV